MREPHGLHVFTFSSPHSIEDWEEGLTEQSPSGTWAKGVGSPPDVYFSEGKSEEPGKALSSS